MAAIVPAAGRGHTPDIALELVSVHEAERPVLPDEIVAEAVMRLFLDEPESGALVDTARGSEWIVRPVLDRKSVV